jgi:imidazolonepropionase-like amidohydrolase
LRGAKLVGVGLVDLEIRDGRIAAIGQVAAGLSEVDASGRFIVPAFVDSHVHLAYRFDAPTLEGERASLLLLDDDPRVDPQTLASLAAVCIDGVLRG